MISHKIVLVLMNGTISDDEQRRPNQRLPITLKGNDQLNKEELYDLFQQVLNVKKFEHQLLYNAMQVKKLNICTHNSARNRIFCHNILRSLVNNI